MDALRHHHLGDDDTLLYLRMVFYPKAVRGRRCRSCGFAGLLSNHAQQDDIADAILANNHNRYLEIDLMENCGGLVSIAPHGAWPRRTSHIPKFSRPGLRRDKF